MESLAPRPRINVAIRLAAMDWREPMWCGGKNITDVVVAQRDGRNRGELRRAPPEFAAISAVALRHNDISNVLSTAPHRFAPVHGRKPNGDVDARPWCQGFHAAMRLRLSAWAPLLDLRNIHHGLLLPILLHCVDDQGRPLLGPPRKGRETEQFLRNAHTDMPHVAEAMR